MLIHEFVFEVLGGTLTSPVDGGLFYPLRQSNRYPCNQICYARGAFESQTLYKPNLYKWASFVHRIQYSCSIYCCAANGFRSTNAPRWKWASTHANTQHSVSLCFFKKMFPPSLSPECFITHTHEQPRHILSNLCRSNLWVIVEMAGVEEVNQWLCREAVFPIKEKADACIGLRLLTDSCKDEQWDCPAS